MSRPANHRGWSFIVAILALSICAEAEAQPTPPKIAPAGRWSIEGTDKEGTQWTGDMMLKAGDDGAITGHIDWSGSGGTSNGASGREIVSATFDPETRLLNLKGVRLERAKNIGLGEYTAELAEDGKRLENGKWSAGDASDKWEAKRGEKVKRPAAASEADDEPVWEKKRTRMRRKIDCGIACSRQ